MPKGFSIYRQNGLSQEARAERLIEVERKISSGEYESKKQKTTLLHQRSRLKYPEKYRAIRKRYNAAHPDRVKANAKVISRRVKRQVFEHYSGPNPFCACCGEKEFDFLSVDHIGGGGLKHRREIGGAQALYSWLRRNDYPSGYRILCFNCNLASGFFRICPHQRKEK